MIPHLVSFLRMFKKAKEELTALES